MNTHENRPATADLVAWTGARVHRRRWLTVLTAMAVATAGWGIAEQLLGIDLAVRSGGDAVRQVSSFAVTLTSLAVGFAGWALLALLERRTLKARRVWTVIAVAVFTVSLLGPLGAVTPEATTVLIGMHCVVAAILIYGLRRTADAPWESELSGDRLS